MRGNARFMIWWGGRGLGGSGGVVLVLLDLVLLEKRMETGMGMGLLGCARKARRSLGSGFWI